MDDDDFGGDSDPLPFTQTHRSAKPKLATLAGRLGLPYPHVRGAVEEWWDLFGDPRDIERRIAKGEHAIDLTAAEVVHSFEVAAAAPVKINPADLVLLGFLERLEGDRFRLRGMSRFFGVVEQRLASRAHGKRGGLKSAALRAEAGATPGAQVSGQWGAQAGGRQDAQAGGRQEQRATEQRGKSKEPKGKRSEPRLAGEAETAQGKAQEQLPGIPEPPPKERQLSEAEETIDNLLMLRKEQCRLDGIEPAVEDLSPAYINAAVKRADEPANLKGKPGHLISLFDLFLLRPSAAEKGFPIRYFLTPGVLESLLKELMKKYADEAAAEQEQHQ